MMMRLLAGEKRVFNAYNFPRLLLSIALIKKV